MNRPYTVVQVAASVDGRISIAPNHTMWEDLADERLRSTMGGNVWSGVDAVIRSTFDPQADMLGSASLVNEGQELEELSPTALGPEVLFRDYLPQKVIERPDHRGWLVVVDGRGRLRSGFKEAPDNPGWHMLHLVSHSVSPEYLALLQDEQIPYLIAGNDRVDLAAAMEKLREQLGVERLLSTAGGRLCGALLREGLVDEINIIVHPVVIGGFETPSLFDSPDLGADEWPTRLQLISAQVQAEGTLWLRYRVDHERDCRR